MHRGVSKLFVNTKTSFITNTDERLSHPKGYFQPGVLGIDSNKRTLSLAQRTDSREYWRRIRETNLSYIHKQIAASLQQTDNSKDALLDNEPELIRRANLSWYLLLC